MPERLALTAAHAACAGWLRPALEADLYEGIRGGDGAAFQAIAEALQPVLLRLAGLAGGSRADAEQRVVRTWALALGGLDMFAWQTPFATWVAGITVALGRTAPASSGPAPRPPPRGAVGPGPADWSDLPWSPRWTEAWPTLRCAVARLPLAEREAVHVGDIERWPRQRACAVLARPQGAYQGLLRRGRARLHDALAPLAGAAPGDRHLEPRVAAVVAMLPELLEDDEQALDPRVDAVFLRWRRGPGRRRPLLDLLSR